MLWPLFAVVALAVVALLPPRSSAEVAFTVGAYVFYGTLLLAGLTAARTAGITPADIVGDWPPGAQPWLMALAATLLLMVFTVAGQLTTIGIAVGVAPDWAARQLVELDEPDDLERFSGMSRALIALNIAILGPIVEEFVTRGLLLRRWIARWGFWPGLLWSSALFAVLHPHMWLGAMAVGVMLSLLYLWSRSLLVPILAHVVNNGLIVLVTLMISGDDEPATVVATNPAQALAEIWSAWPIALVMFLAAAALLVVLARPMVRGAGAVRSAGWGVKP